MFLFPDLDWILNPRIREAVEAKVIAGMPAMLAKLQTVEIFDPSAAQAAYDHYAALQSATRRYTEFKIQQHRLRREIYGSRSSYGDYHLMWNPTKSEHAASSALLAKLMEKLVYVEAEMAKIKEKHPNLKWSYRQKVGQAANAIPHDYVVHPFGVV